MDSRSRQFEALVDAYASDLYRYAVWLGNTREGAEDLVQEAFLRAWRFLDELRDARAARAWLLTILRREHARRFERPRAERVPLDGVDMESIEAPAGAERAEVLALRQGLAALPRDFREPLVLQVLGGYSCEEIGGMLGLKPGAVATRLSRARRKLRRGLSSGRSARRMEGTR